LLLILPNATLKGSPLPSLGVSPMLIYSWLPYIVELMERAGVESDVSIAVSVTGGVTLCFCLISTGLFALLSNLLVMYTLPMFRLLVLLVLVAWLVGLITSTTAGTFESLVGKENTLLAILAKAVLNGSTLALFAESPVLINSCVM